MKKLTVCAVCALATCACTPGQVVDVASALGVDIGPDTAMLVSARLEQPADCETALRRTWPPSLWPRMRQIIWRESRGDARAQNRHSSAAGCTQIVRGSWRNTAGCTWADRYSAWCNLAAAYELFKVAGWSPWG